MLYFSLDNDIGFYIGLKSKSNAIPKREYIIAYKCILMFIVSSSWFT